jgi:type IV secretory pathway VirB9-like protein
MVKCSVLVLVGLALAVPAWAVDHPRQSRKDSRIWELNFDPDNPAEIWSAPGSELLLRFAPDERVITAKSADSPALAKGTVGNLVVLKFKGCMVPQPLFVFTQRGNDPVPRSYVFQVETVPRICDTSVTKRVSNAVAQNDGATSDAAGSWPGTGAAPDLKHLPTPDALDAASNTANGGRIPWVVNVRYPADDAARRRAATKLARAAWRKQEAEQLLRLSSNTEANLGYSGLGDVSLKPRHASDDGYTTTFEFLPMQTIPIVTKLGNPSVLCGTPNADEASTDFDVKGTRMTIAGMAQAWCLRSGSAVYEVWNRGYTGFGKPPPTGTTSRSVERVVGGR